MRNRESSTIRATVCFGFVLVTASVVAGVHPVLRPGEGEALVPAARSPMAEPAQAPVPATESLQDQVYPLPTNVEIREFVVGVEGGAVAGTSRLVYSNTLGAAVFAPSGDLASARIADDITTTGANWCNLDRYVIMVSGDREGDGSGVGPFSIDVALYEVCPGAGGAPIPGTAAHVDFSDNGTYTLAVVIPPDVDIPIPSSLYLGLSFSRDKCGVVVGAPPTMGFSADRFDFPGFPCAAGFGGFPRAPHASFYAEIYVRDDCAASFVGYKNTNHAGSPFSAGVRERFADDVRLGVTECNMVAYEIAHRGDGIIGVDLRSFLSNTNPSSGGVIPGTAMYCWSSGDDVQICRKEFYKCDGGERDGEACDPNEPVTQECPGGSCIIAPIALPRSTFFVVYQTSSGYTGPVLTCKQANPGGTENFFRVYTGGGWAVQEFPGQCWSGFELTIFCEEQPPLGACCDMILTDEEGEAVCRELPEMNCAFRELWEEGGTCESVCIGGSNDGEPCTRQVDCPGGECPGPFNHPCGVAACCKPEGGCENLTENACYAIEPVDAPRMYQRGDFCGEGGQRCPIHACLDGEGDCCEARGETLCVGGNRDGEPCDPWAPWPGDCPGYSCTGGPHDGDICDRDADCPGGGTCVDGVCDGGANDGQPCDRDRQCLPGGACREALCLGQPGCGDPICCIKVCNWVDPWNPWWPPPYGYCCTRHWDGGCAAMACRICACGTPRNDECWSPEAPKGARLVEIPSASESDGIRATTSPTEPGFCCHEEDPGAQGVGTVWYKFVATETSALLDTCCTLARADAPGDDLLMQVFAVADPDRGLCADGLTLCSVSMQDCPDGSECVLDEKYACANLMPIACSDDEETCACMGIPQPTRSKLCVTGLVPGEMYYVMVGARTEENRGVYKLRIMSPCTPPLPPLHNDLCMNADQLSGEHVVVPFDVSGEMFGEAPATFDCPGPPVTCFDVTTTLQNDVWYEWTAPCNGTATFQTCGFDEQGIPRDELTDDTAMVVYDGCVTPVKMGTEEICSWWMSSPCFSGSYGEIEVTEGNCYKVRLGGRLGKTHDEYPVGSGIYVPIAGDLRIDVECVSCPPGTVTFIDPPSGVVDARRPHPPTDPSSREGIDRVLVEAPAGAGYRHCWSLCETVMDGSPNQIAGIVDNGHGTFTIALDRPISAGAVTTISYHDSDGVDHLGAFTSHPANVNGDGQATPSDILSLIDVINGVREAPWGKYSADCDHSGTVGPPDILCIIDLLNGASAFDAWLNTPLPSGGECQP